MIKGYVRKAVGLRATLSHPNKPFSFDNDNNRITRMRHMTTQLCYFSSSPYLLSMLVLKFSLSAAVPHSDSFHCSAVVFSPYSRFVGHVGS